ncbi:MAG: DnaJ domain-containing protein [Chloroflexi bacterium]|jgi:DnaJ-class molecular chaperone|nr:DnaJ domain-containing protein [Chloroflexota bacterium]
MKDYYDILGVPEEASADDVRSAFRKLAFEHHPDRNPGDEKQAEERFKEINEAYSVLCDQTRRTEYDAFRNGRFSGADFNRSAGGFGYSQEDIFKNAFANGAIFEELNRMFAQMGLRFDDDLRNRTFSGGQNVHFRFYSSPGGARRSNYSRGSSPTRNDIPNIYGSQPVVRKPNFAERMMGKAVSKLSKYAIKKAFGIDLDLPPEGDDIHQDLKISSQEAAKGCQKRVRYKRGKENKTIEVTVPVGIASGKKIKISGMGEQGMEPGDLYLLIKVK